MELTPLEKIQQSHANFSIYRAALNATLDLIKVSDECQDEIDVYRANLRAGIKSTEEQRTKTAAAMRDSRAANEAFAALAETFELKFGISA
tara:strand:- start:524 stop:796 length:273 start_codon:yes stop_codon:yes gene_type:complete